MVLTFESTSKISRDPIQILNLISYPTDSCPKFTARKLPASSLNRVKHAYDFNIGSSANAQIKAQNFLKV